MTEIYKHLKKRIKANQKENQLSNIKIFSKYNYMED